MKLLPILSIVLLNSLTDATSPLAAHQIRDLDPRDHRTMDATKLSILSVLHTAIPTTISLPLPTGTMDPEWYRNLPSDVKSLLPILWPAPTTSMNITTKAQAMQESTSTTTTTRRTTVTKTLQRPSSSVGNVLPIPSTNVSVFAAPSNVSVATGAPLPTGFMGGAGGKGVEMRVVMACVGTVLGAWVLV